MPIAQIKSFISIHLVFWRAPKDFAILFWAIGYFLLQDTALPTNIFLLIQHSAGLNLESIPSCFSVDKWNPPTFTRFSTKMIFDMQFHMLAIRTWLGTGTKNSDRLHIAAILRKSRLLWAIITIIPV